MPVDKYEPEEGFLSAQDMYRAACEPAAYLPDNFATSLVRYVFFLERGHEYTEPPRDNLISPPWSTALRSAIREVAEWVELLPKAEDAIESMAHKALGRPAKTAVEMYHEGRNLERRYCSNTLLRKMAQELCRHSVPPSERLL